MQVTPGQLEPRLALDRARAAAPSRPSAGGRPPSGSGRVRSGRRSEAGSRCRAQARHPPRRTPSAGRRGTPRGDRPCRPRLDALAPRVGSLPSEKTARSRSATTNALNRGPHSWTSEGSSHVRAPFRRRAHGSTAARRAACCPGGPPTRHAAGARSGRQSLVERPGEPSEAQDLVAAQAESWQRASGYRGTSLNVERTASADTTVPTVARPYRSYFAW